MTKIKFDIFLSNRLGTYFQHQINYVITSLKWKHAEICLFLIYAIEFTVTRLDASENCLYFSFRPLNNHAKLELCPKIKLNKSLRFFFLLLVATNISWCLYIFGSKQKKNIFTIFPLRWYFVLSETQKEEIEEIERRKNSVVFISKDIFSYCSPTLTSCCSWCYGS